MFNRQQMQRIPNAKVRNIGVSNFGIKHLEAMLHHPGCYITPAVNQIEVIAQFSKFQSFEAFS
jgi:glycerol 2-dehydrogenase (NADP+)